MDNIFEENYQDLQPVQTLRILKSQIVNGVLIKLDEEDLVNGHFECTEQIIEIGDNAISNCQNLTSVSYTHVIKMGDEAFANCQNLTTVNLPQLTTLGNWSFTNCLNLVSIYLPKLQTIGDMAFNYCPNLTTGTLPHPTKIGILPFLGCKNLQMIIIIDNLLNSDLDAETIINQLPITLIDNEIILKSDLYKRFLDTKKILNKEIIKDLHPKILSTSLDVMFFSPKINALFSDTTPEDVTENSNYCTIL